MSKQVLVPVQSVEDADQAMTGIPDIVAPGDEVVMLAILPVPEKELVGSEPPPPASESFISTTGGAPGRQPRTPSDKPVFMSSEELMELQGREMCETLANRTQALRDNGIEVRVDAMFSDTPTVTIRDYMGDVDADEVRVTQQFKDSLDKADDTLAQVLPGT